MSFNIIHEDTTSIISDAVVEDEGGEMPFKIIRDDITKVKADAVVNAANNTLLGGGGVDGAIHRAAGSELLKECQALGGCPTGSAKITGGYKMPCKYIIHTVGPVWQGGNSGEEKLLYSCYMNSLEIAKKNGCKTIAFPLISAGAYGYPKTKAIAVAVRAFSDFLQTNEMDITLVVFEREAVQLSEKLAGELCQYIDDNYANVHYSYSEDILEQRRRNALKGVFSGSLFAQPYQKDNKLKHSSSKQCCPNCGKKFISGYSFCTECGCSLSENKDYNLEAPRCYISPSFDENLEDALSQLDLSFSERLFLLIDQSGLSDVQVYKRANVDRKLFSKIRSDKNYKPKKTTVLAFAIALKLSLNDTEALLKTAGFAFSHSNKADVIMEFFIKHNNFNIYEINEALFSYDQPLLGGG